LCDRCALDRVFAVPFSQPIGSAVGRSPTVGPLADAKLLRTAPGDKTARRHTEEPYPRAVETE
jgi:hypothetical protein